MGEIHHTFSVKQSKKTKQTINTWLNVQSCHLFGYRCSSQLFSILENIDIIAGRAITSNQIANGYLVSPLATKQRAGVAATGVSRGV